MDLVSPLPQVIVTVLKVFRWCECMQLSPCNGRKEAVRRRLWGVSNREPCSRTIQTGLESTHPPSRSMLQLCIHVVSAPACPQGSTAAGATCTLRFTLMGFMCSSEIKNQGHSQASPAGRGLIRGQAHQCLGQELSEPLLCLCWISAILIESPKCADAGSTQQHPGSCFPALPCQVMDHIPAANQSAALEPVSCSTDPPGAQEMWTPSMGCATLSTHPQSTPPHKPPQHLRRVRTKSPGAFLQNKRALLAVFKETNQA